MNSSSLPETTEILCGEDAARFAAEFIAVTKQTLDVVADSAAPSVTVNVESYKRLLLSLKQRGTRVRYIVEITPDNLGYCKQMTEFVELRHLDDIKGNFGVADGNDYFASATLEQNKPIMQLIHSNVKQIVQQHQYLFRTLWALATPAEQKIQEIESGKASPPNTKIIDSQEDIISRTRYVIETSNHLFVCSTLDGLKMIESIASDSIKKILGKAQKGEHKGVRWIGTISKEHIDVVQRFLASGMEIKHLRYTPLNFSVTDKEFNFTVSNMIEGSIAPSVLISNEQPYINQFNSLFEQLWLQGIDAADKIRELEEDIPADRIEVIHNPEEIKRIYFDLIESAKNEIMLILPTATAFKREEKMGIIESLMEAATRGVKVRILTPTDYETDEVVRKTQSLKESHSIDVRTIRPVKTSSETVEIKIVVVDRKASLIIELKDDSKQTFIEAVSSAVYGTGRPRVMSYVTIFDSFWNQSELYEQLREANKKLEKTNEQLQIHDKMQTEFVNIAAHELRTPVQPILAMVDMLKDDLEGKKEAIITEEVVAILERNSHRLQKLSSEILDATRIESGTLRLEQSLVDLNVKVRNVVEDSKSLIPQGQKISIQFKPYIGASRNDNAATTSSPSPLPVMADKLRMFEVISNLIRNAIKYSSRSDGGSPESGRTITVSTEKQGNEAIVSVKDQGVGINPDFMPRLFTKFAIDRVSGGTGLGLYISKAILEAHGGRIWAENNKDGKGATFYFALPLAKEGFDP